MCPQLFSCPLCARPSFESLDSLRIGLVSVATRPLMCPVCNETLLGIDKLTIHLFGHTISTLEAEKVKEDSVNDSGSLCGANINHFHQQDVCKSSSGALMADKEQNFQIKDQNFQAHKVPLKNVPSVSQLKDSGAINKHQREAQLPLTWSSDLLLPNMENTCVKLVKSVNDENILPNAKQDLCKDKEMVRKCTLNQQIECASNASSVDLEETKGECKSLGSNEIQALHLKPLRNLAEKTERCNMCGFHFPDYNILLLHKQLVHMVAEKDVNNVNIQSEVLLKNYPCHLCHKVFKMRGSLMVHMRVAHVGYSSGPLSNEKDTSQVGCETGFNCPTCGKNFRKEQHVTQHLKTHEAKQWACDVCCKMFTTKYFLKKHKRLHSGEMPYKCDICSKTFTFQQSYHKHRLYHKDDKPHTCTTCGRSFKELSTLHNHERIHTGEKPFACETCGKCFRQRVSYLVHRRIHTGVMPYTCTACGKSFRYKVSQRTHKCPATDISESLEQSESHLLPVTSSNEKSDLSPVKDKSIPIDPLLPIDLHQVNKFILVVDDDGRALLKRESDLNSGSTNHFHNNNNNSNNINNNISSSNVHNNNIDSINNINNININNNNGNKKVEVNLEGPKILPQDDDDVLNESLQVDNTPAENFYTIGGISLPDIPAVNLRSNLSSPSMEMKQLRLSSPTNEDTFMRPIDPFKPFTENPDDLHKDIKHAIDGILKERHTEDNPQLEIINEESFKQLFYGIDKETSV